jgi:tape measure domain-containing protein
MPEQVRASDADRDAVIERLSRAFAQGRLTADEFEERVATACAARTMAELLALTRDLPGGLW